MKMSKRARICKMVSFDPIFSSHDFDRMGVKSISAMFEGEAQEGSAQEAGRVRAQQLTRTQNKLEFAKSRVAPY
jgi:hypothetical protein